MVVGGAQGVEKRHWTPEAGQWTRIGFASRRPFAARKLETGRRLRPSWSFGGQVSLYRYTGGGKNQENTSRLLPLDECVPDGRMERLMCARRAWRVNQTGSAEGGGIQTGAHLLSGVDWE